MAELAPLCREDDFLLHAPSPVREAFHPTFRPRVFNLNQSDRGARNGPVPVGWQLLAH